MFFRKTIEDAIFKIEQTAINVRVGFEDFFNDKKELIKHEVHKEFVEEFKELFEKDSQKVKGLFDKTHVEIDKVRGTLDHEVKYLKNKGNQVEAVLHERIRKLEDEVKKLKGSGSGGTEKNK